MGNSAYGKTPPHIEDHVDVSYCRESELQDHFKKPNLCGEVQIDQNLYEISTNKKNNLTFDLSAQICIRKFIFDCIGHYLKRD